jgi:hypothetical protein
LPCVLVTARQACSRRCGSFAHWYSVGKVIKTFLSAQ